MCRRRRLGKVFARPADCRSIFKARAGRWTGRDASTGEAAEGRLRHRRRENVGRYLREPRTLQVIPATIDPTGMAVNAVAKKPKCKATLITRPSDPTPY